MPRRRHTSAALGPLLALAAAPLGAQSAPAPPIEVPAWAFPLLSSGAPQPPFDSVTRVTVPGSRMLYTEAEILGHSVVPDWHPADHPPMPPSVARGRMPAVQGCAFCHLPNGLGRPENAQIAGLPAEYIVRQVADMKSGARRPAWTGNPAWGTSMTRVAMNATDAEVAEAAAYFARLPARSHVRVVESTTVPATRVAGSLYALVPNGGTEPLGARLVEFATDHARHERHDDGVGYVAYVPPGSVARGARLAARGTDGPATACVACHGPGLRGLSGTGAPPLAGRSPSHLLRQLLAFRTGTRDTPAGQPMRAVVAPMTIEDMIAAVAYAASLRP
ncbi:cytochrome c class I [Gemmatirosa kalamazoonensis]|uniref:Cytochrome c class I n=1 Tax=Gemmatirosa kalamazoonensis TaxID=861299 RepID=W0RCD3_9BACT|nr:c-type cytochrome [Gemmatirosa kalamazoonensis]AHG88107.1 cytochrome c class I [Gemmatirosa kalamazoonensis]